MQIRRSRTRRRDGKEKRADLSELLACGSLWAGLEGWKVTYHREVVLGVMLFMAKRARISELRLWYNTLCCRRED